MSKTTLKSDTKYYYVIIDKGGRLLLKDGRLPIYWRLKVANADAKKFEGSTVRKIYSMNLINIIE